MFAKKEFHFVMKTLLAFYLTFWNARVLFITFSSKNNFAALNREESALA